MHSRSFSEERSFKMDAALVDGISRLSKGDLAGAEALLTEAAALAAASCTAGDAAATLVSGRSLGNLGAIYAKRRMPREALEFSAQALDRFRQMNDNERCSLVLFNMANYAYSLPATDKERHRAASYMREVTALTNDTQRLEDAKRWLQSEADSSTNTGAGASTPIGGASPGGGLIAFFTPVDQLDSYVAHADQLGSNESGPASEQAHQQAPGSSSSSAPPHGQPSSSSAGSGFHAFEHSFANLWWGDVVSRVGQEEGLCEAVEALLKAKAGAADACARGVAEAAGTLAPQLSHTGLGIAPLIHGAQRPAGGASGVASVVKSAFSFFKGSSADASPSPPAPDPNGGSGGGGGGNGGFSVSTGGYDSTRGALAAARKSLQREALGHARQASTLREASAQLAAFRSAYSGAASKALSRGNELVRSTLAALANLRRANAQLQRARREEEDARVAVQSALNPPRGGAAGTPGGEGTPAAGGGGGGGTPALPTEAEVQRRLRRHAEALAAAEAAEEGVRAAADHVVTCRRGRDDELASLAAQLQGVDVARRTAVGAALRSLASSGLDAAELLGDAYGRLASAVEGVDPHGDMRTFLHQRRTAIALDQLAAKQQQQAAGGDGGGGVGPDGSPLAPLPRDPDDASHLIPSPISAGAAAKHGRGYLRAESDLAPLMLRWAQALLRGEGCETLHGQRVGAPGETTPQLGACATVVPATGSLAMPDGDGPDPPSALLQSLPPVQLQQQSPQPQPLFEVSLLDQQAARNALLRALSALRAQVQHLSPPAFARFVRVFWWALDACAAHDDARSASTVLILSETFYTRQASKDAHDSVHSEGGMGGRPDRKDSDCEVNPRHASQPDSAAQGPKVFLQSLIRQHPIWRGSDLWAEAFYGSCREELGKLIDPSAASHSRLASLFAASEGDDQQGNDAEGGGPGDFDAPASKRGSDAALQSSAMLSPSSSMPGPALGDDAPFHYQQILFGQLMASALNQASFGLPREQVARTVTALGLANGLPRHMLDAVRGVTGAPADKR